MKYTPPHWPDYESTRFAHEVRDKKEVKNCWEFIDLFSNFFFQSMLYISNFINETKRASENTEKLNQIEVFFLNLIIYSFLIDYLFIFLPFSLILLVGKGWICVLKRGLDLLKIIIRDFFLIFFADYF